MLMQYREGKLKASEKYYKKNTMRDQHSTIYSFLDI